MATLADTICGSQVLRMWCGDNSIRIAWFDDELQAKDSVFRFYILSQNFHTRLRIEGPKQGI